MTKPCLEVSKLEIGLPHTATPIVKGVSFALNPGEILGIIGESGSGKSTLATALAGLLAEPLEHIAGTVRIDGETLDFCDAAHMQSIRGRRMAMVFQDPLTSWNPSFTIWTQIRDAVSAHNLYPNSKDIFRAAVSALDSVGIHEPEQVIRRYPHELSGGMRQRALIAIALMLRASVLIADEPTSALDVTTQAQVLQLLRQIADEKGTGIVIISHDLRSIRRVADRVAVMYQGDLVEIGPVEEVYRKPRHDYTAKLLAAMPSAEEARMHPAGVDVAAQPVLVRVSNISVSYGRRRMFSRIGPGTADKTVLRDVSLSLHRGEILGLIGESGAGKSTVGRAVMGLQRVDAGRVELAGSDLSDRRPGARKALARKVQMIFQDPHASLSPHLTIGQLLSEPFEIHKIPVGERRTPGELLAMVGMGPEHLAKYACQLSGGQARRVGIARALSLRPDLIVADEPSAGLDLSVAASILKLLRDLRDRTGQSCLVVSHDIDMLGMVADRIAVMKGGEIVETGTAARIICSPVHPYTRSLIAASRDHDRF